MNFFLLDSRALVKRYLPEPATQLLDRFLTSCKNRRLIGSLPEAPDMVAGLVRKQKQGRLTPALLSAVLFQLERDFLHNTEYGKLPAEDAIIEDCFTLLDRHGIGCLDGIFVRMALELAGKLRTKGDDLVGVTPKKRLLQVLRAEGLTTFDPERQTQAELDALLGP